MSWFAIFLYLWAAGISGALALVPSRVFGRSFFRVHAAILLVVVTVATAVGRPLMQGAAAGSVRFLNEAIAWLMVGDVIVLSALAFSRSRSIVPVAFLLPVIAGAVFATTLALGSAPGKPVDAALLTLHFLTCGALLGSVLVAMNVGHAYLQNAALSFEHLTRLARLFLGAAIAKAVVSLVMLAPETGTWWPQILDTFDGMMIAVRVAAGLAGSIVLGCMVLSCARARANQSATGILYAALVVVLVGEAISMYLTLGRGIRA